MKRIVTLTAAALLAAPAAFAEAHMENGDDEMMTMMEERLQNALADCEITMEDEDTMNLTLAQVSGIIIQSNSEEENQDKCQNIEALLQD